MIYIFSKENLEIIQTAKIIDFSIMLDEETNAKSSVDIIKEVEIVKGDFAYFKDKLFIVDEIGEEDNNKRITLTLLDPTNLFNRVVIEKPKNIMQSDGIEYYIAQCIQDYIVQPTDSVLNIPYIDIYTTSVTKLIEPTNASDGVFNLKTFITNCRQNKSIFTNLVIEYGRLKITIGYELLSQVIFDTTLNEINNVMVNYDVDLVAKVECYITSTNETKYLYLTSNGTTDNPNDVNRLKGSTMAIVSDAYNDETYQLMLNVFKGNRYKHLIEFKVRKSSKLSPFETYQIGSPCLVKVKGADEPIQYDTYISAITETDDEFVVIKSGQLRVNLTDKVKQQRQTTYQNKLVFNNDNIISIKTTDESQDSGYIKANGAGTYVTTTNVKQDFFKIIFANLNTMDNPTVNGLPLKFGGGIILAGEIKSGIPYDVYFNGTEFNLISGEIGTDEYTKFVDGRLECNFAYKPSGTVAINTAYGNLFRSNLIAINFPYSFLKKPIVNSLIEFNGVGGVSPKQSSTNTQLAIYIFNGASLTVASDIITIYIVAKGRWK